MSRPSFAVEKLAQRHASLPLRYPRVNLANWYDGNNLMHAQPGRQLNNYLLTDIAENREEYARAFSDPWFLGAPRVEPADCSAAQEPDPFA